jgi:outer membrane protein assembly factor BamD
LGLIETDTPLPPGETRASQDVIRQYEDAEEQIPDDLKAGTREEKPSRSWFSYLTFGLFD